MAAQGHHALIFGASGISGWSLMKQALSYPAASTFTRITGLCNRPVDKKTLFLPDDPRLNIVSGIDLTAPVDEVVSNLKENVPDVENVDVVFFSAYIQTDDYDSLREINTNLLRTAITAMSTASKSLKTVILQTGGKAYGVEWPDKIPINPPLREDFPRVPEPYASKVFYYTQYDVLKELSSQPGCTWTFSEIRPDGIVGFAPGKNAMNMAQGIALYLSLYREVHGRGAKVPFPGESHGYRARHMDTSQDMLSRLEIYVAVNRDREEIGNGSVFNAADGVVRSWAEKWPGVCKYFGLEGVEAVQGVEKESMEGFVRGHMKEWEALAERFGLRRDTVEWQNWAHTKFMLVQFDFDRFYSMEKVKMAGFEETVETVEGYKVAFDRMVEAKVIPRFEGESCKF
ncbi:hypothetical protein BJY04DRAFT_188185 [Aspergillus karnatakaensis]|uniref:SDR family oxidoreductase n=1 Tax=Aspergillus karnatakaensis TaxID=1810916 RepID=UPI003CCD32B2